MRHRRIFEVLILLALFFCMMALVVMMLSVRKDVKEYNEMEESRLESIYEAESIEESRNREEELLYEQSKMENMALEETALDLEVQLESLAEFWEIALDYRPEKTGSGLRIFIGDSRIVGMQRGITYDMSRDIFICKGGENFQYFEAEAVPLLEKLINEMDVSEVYINMGVNDCANNCKGWDAYTVYNYVGLINSLILKYPLINFYFFSVGRVDGEYHGTRVIFPEELNPYIDDFNMVMKEFCGATYIDTAEYIIREDLHTADGVHYDSIVNQKIYDYVIDY